MNLREIMLYSLLASIKTSENREIEDKVRQNYLVLLSESKLIAGFNSILKSDRFYGEDGAELFDRGQLIKSKLLKMPSPTEFGELIIQVIEFCEEVSQRKSYGLSKVENNFFWKNKVNVIDRKIDEQENTLFKRLAQIDIVTSCMYSQSIDVNVADLCCGNANDMQEAYRAMLYGTRGLSADPWIISEIMSGSETIVYSLNFINNERYNKFISSHNVKKCKWNLWSIYQVNPHTVQNTKFVEKYLFAGVGRLTNVDVNNIESINKTSILSDFDVSKNVQVNLKERNPINIICNYIGNVETLFAINPELFVELLNNQLNNQHYSQLIREGRCLVCGGICDKNHVICGYHFV